MKEAEKTRDELLSELEHLQTRIRKLEKNDPEGPRPETEALLEGARSILKYREFEDAARRIFDACRNQTGAVSGYVALMSRDGSENEVLFLESGGLPCNVDPDLPMPIRGLRAEAYRSKQPVYDNNFEDSGWTAFLPPGHVTLENVLFAPLILDSRAVGVIGLANKPGGFDEHDVHSAAAFADYAAIALQNSRAMEALQKSEARYRALSESLEETVRKKVTELQQAESLAALGRMVSVVAHEVRNPLQNIRMGFDEIRAKTKGKLDRTEVFEDVDHGIRLLDTIVTDLLDYSRQVKLEYSPVAVKDIVGQAVKSLEHRFGNRTVTLELEQQERDIVVDPAKVTAVLINLLSNAVDATTDDADIRISSRFRNEEDADTLELSISDTGHGIKDEHLSQVQNPFFTTKNRGTGLGLSICGKILTAHKGHMSITSRINVGTTVRILLPVANPSAD
jgi:signal transduction histidine kinase